MVIEITQATMAQLQWLRSSRNATIAAAAAAELARRLLAAGI